MSNGELWILEWHRESNSIHIQPLTKATSNNLSRFHQDEKPGGRVPICVGSRAEVDAQASDIRPTLLARQAAKELNYV